jgi:hypothetical protein
MSALNIIKNGLAKDITECSAKLIAFDRVFDEDILHAKYEQLEIVTVEIDALEMMLISCMEVSGNLDYSETDKYKRFADKLSLFHERETQVKVEINELLSTRDVLYKKWKEDYILHADKFGQAQTKLRKIQDIENSLLSLTCNNIKANNNIIMLVYVHSQVNRLLSLANLKKENVPYNAFRVALNNNLIDDRTYEFLKP